MAILIIVGKWSTTIVNLVIKARTTTKIRNKSCSQWYWWKFKWRTLKLKKYFKIWF